HRAEACNHPWVAWAVQAEAEVHTPHSSEGEAVAAHNPHLGAGYSRLWVEWAGHPWGAFRFRPWAAFRPLSVRCRHRIADHKTCISPFHGARPSVHIGVRRAAELLGLSEHYWSRPKRIGR